MLHAFAVAWADALNASSRMQEGWFEQKNKFAVAAF